MSPVGDIRLDLVLTSSLADHDDDAAQRYPPGASRGTPNFATVASRSSGPSRNGTTSASTRMAGGAPATRRRSLPDRVTTCSSQPRSLAVWSSFAAGDGLLYTQEKSWAQARKQFEKVHISDLAGGKR